MVNPPVKPTRGTFISAMCLVGGTSIGGGMLALPVSTGISGLLPSMVMMVICWLAMTISGLLLLEVTLWMQPGEHMISMSSRFLGRAGMVVSWILYSFICYSSLIAYTAEGSQQLVAALYKVTGIELSKSMACLLFILFFGLIIDMGARVVGRINAVLFTGMILSYCALVGVSAEEINYHLLAHRHWPTIFVSIPLLITSFSYQTVIPSLTPYLQGHVKYLRWSIIGGTTIALLVYAVWEWLILGLIPVNGDHGLITALVEGSAATNYLQTHVHNQWIPLIAEYFAFFALVTSFLGFGLGLFDFLADGLHIKKRGWGKIALGLLIILPIFFFASQFERIFLLALDHSGGVGDTILNGMIPVLMVWVGRYSKKIVGPYRVWGGKFLLVTVFLFFLFALLQKILIDVGVMHSLNSLRKSLDGGGI